MTCCTASIRRCKKLGAARAGPPAGRGGDYDDQRGATVVDPGAHARRVAILVPISLMVSRTIEQSHTRSPARP
jgi:hypothetical protein